MLRWNFSEFTIFSPHGLNPFKIHGRFKLELIPKFISWDTVEIWSWANWQSCLLSVNQASCHVWIFWGIEKVFILNFQLRTSLVIRKITQISLWAGPYTVRPTSNLNWPKAQHRMASAPCRTPCQAWGRSHRLDLSSPDRLRPHRPTCAPPTECHPHAPSHATLSSMGIPVEGESRVCLLIQLHISLPRPPRLCSFCRAAGRCRWRRSVK
jgi:hypothetical protein